MDGHEVLEFGIVDDTDLEVTACSNKAFYDKDFCSQYLNIDLLKKDLEPANG